MKTGGTLLFVCLLAGSVQSQDADVTLDTAPPVVVKTVPVAGGAEVDPGLKEVRVTFSKEMRADSFSVVVAGKDTFPKLAGKAKFDADKRTFIVPVQLAPGKTYAMWFNRDKQANFKDADGRSALPYLLVFQTKN